MTDRQAKIVLDGVTRQEHPVDTGIPQGSPVASVLFVTYLSGIFDEAEREVPGIRGLSFADDIACGRKGEKSRRWQTTCLRQVGRGGQGSHWMGR